MFHVPCSKNQGGFTIIELTIVLALFFLIIAAATSIFLSGVVQQRRTLQEQELLNESSFAIDSMSRSIQVATSDPDGSCLGTANYMYQLTHCPSDGTACNGIKFINPSDSNACTEFYLDDDGVFKKAINGASPQNVLSDKLTVVYARFLLNGDKTVQFIDGTTPVLFQPRITILLDIKVPDVSGSQEKVIQTTVTQQDFLP